MMITYTKTLAVQGIVDQAHLDEIVDAINALAYVSDIGEPA